jgi:hypothetical protein
MPLMSNDQPEYFKAEFFGEPNSGKSYLALSIAHLIPPKSEKNKIYYFTNESSWKSSVDDFPKYKDNITTYYHTNLNELLDDWDTFVKSYSVQHPKTKELQFNYFKFEKEVHAVVIDEGEFIYRDGYVKRFIELQKEKYAQYKMSQSDWGDPRSDFILFTKGFFSKPCHAILTSKVGFEYEGVRKERRDGTPGALTFEKTGKHKYRLPDAQHYEPNLRIYMFSTDRPYDEEKDKAQYDEAGDLIEYFDYWGRIKKNKADRDFQPVIKNPDFKDVKRTLDRMRRNKHKRMGLV